MTRRAGLRTALVALAAFLPVLAAPEGTPTSRYPPEQMEAARAELRERLRGCHGADECAGLYARIVLVDRPGGALEALAREQWIANVGRTRATLFALWPSVDVRSKVEILDAFRAHWSLLVQGVYPDLTSMVSEALESGDPALREAGARLAAMRPIPRIAWPMIDAASEHPELTQTAILAVGRERARYAARWVVRTALATDDPAIAGAARWTIFNLGRAAADMLKEALDGPDPQRAARAADLLLVIAIPEDEAVLTRWLASRGEARPDLAGRVRRRLAELDTGLLPRTAPPIPELRLAPPAP